jgi:hypothetical protein
MHVEAKYMYQEQRIFTFLQEKLISCSFLNHFINNEKNPRSKESRFLPASFTVILFLAIIPLLFTYVFAQGSPLSSNDSKSLGPQGLLGPIHYKTSSATTIDTQLNSTSTNLPILTKTSDKGIYKVQLRWSSPPGIQSPNSLPKNGFTMEILFLNATAPEPTNQTIPKNGTNLRDDTSLQNGATPISEPSSNQNLLPIDSFDITIYSEDGKVLWHKSNPPIIAGKAAEKITFANGYTGGITILINNIKASSGIDSTTAARLSNTNITTAAPQSTNANQSAFSHNPDGSLKTDSVKFTAKVT